MLLQVNWRVACKNLNDIHKGSSEKNLGMYCRFSSFKNVKFCFLNTIFPQVVFNETPQAKINCY